VTEALGSVGELAAGVDGGQISDRVAFIVCA
jgi:hypothetical protein